MNSRKNSEFNTCFKIASFEAIDNRSTGRLLIVQLEVISRKEQGKEIIWES